MKKLIENYKDYLKRGEFVTTTVEHVLIAILLYSVYAFFKMILQ
jgi:hypothetical protein